MKTNLLLISALTLIFIISANAQHVSTYKSPLNFKTSSIGDRKDPTVLFDQKNGTDPTETFNECRKRPFTIIEDSTYQYSEDSPGQFVLHSRTTDIVYNDHYKKVSEVTQHTDGSSWYNGGKKKYAYDGHGNLVKQLDCGWDGERWKIFFRTTMTYDCHNNRTVMLYERFERNEWKNGNRYTYTYDSNGNTTSELTEDWVNGAWEKVRKTTSTYNSCNKLAYQLFENISFNGSYTVGRITYHYDANNNNDVKFAELPVGNCCWEPYVKSINKYNAANLLIKQKLLSWKEGAWTLDATIRYKYGVANILEEMEEDNVHDEIVSVRWHYYFHKQYLHKAERSDTEAGISMQSKINLQPVIYPNPSTGSCVIQFEDNRMIRRLEIYNVQGAKVAEQTDPEMNITTPGLYIVKIYEGENMYQQKVLIQ